MGDRSPTADARRSGVADQQCVVLVAGAPRSGTTWLAKILDSHPEVLYRHEPDAAAPLPDACSPVEIAAAVRRWCADRSPRAAGKRPFFPKAYRRGWQSRLRDALAASGSVGARVGGPFRGIGSVGIPDLAFRDPGCVVVKSISLGAAAGAVAAAHPDCRLVFILRHPGGQVASVMRGAKLRRFELRTDGTDMPFDEAATLRFAIGFGVDDAAFQALPDAAKYAWAWRAFNEPACAALSGLPNHRLVTYETLCTDPVTEARTLLAFCGLGWSVQTEAFIRRSTAHGGETGYYGVFRNAGKAAEAWRSSLSAAEQAAIRAVVQDSPLTERWPDLVK